MRTPRFLHLFRLVSIGSAVLLAAAPVSRAQEAAESDGGRAELVFDASIPETPGIFERISKQPLVSDQYLKRAELISVYNATSAPLQSRDGAAVAIAGANAPKALEGNSNSIMLFGPYAKMERGHYLVVYRFKVADAPDRKGKIFLDVSHNACTRSGLRLPAETQPTQWQEVAVPVLISEPIKLEFRFWPGGNTCAVDRIYVFKVEPGASPKKPEELPPGRPVEGRTDVVRSPHTNSSGMIDITGLKKGDKVVCPYTGKYFQLP